MISVIHVYNADFSDPQTVYCGRAVPSRKLKASPLGNPYKIPPGDVSPETRAACIERFRSWFYETIARHRGIGEAILELERLVDLATQGDLRLVCWCAPQACHCDVIKEYIERKLLWN